MHKHKRMAQYVNRNLPGGLNCCADNLHLHPGRHYAQTKRDRRSMDFPDFSPCIEGEDDMEAPSSRHQT
jgi:hypothetical protein